jgi:MarR family transcriptional regulator, transcriptional regulator for hemolysin
MPRPDLQRNFGFLLSDISRLFRREFNRRAGDLDLTQAQWRALAHLSRQENVRQAALAEQLEIQPMTLARQLDRLEAAGWVERRPDPDDRRAVRLHLTPAAGPLIDRIAALAGEIRGEAMAGLEAADRERLLDALCAVRANLQRITRDGLGEGTA